MKILLSDWAARQYTPAPSAWVLRKWARNGEISPPPEKAGRDWYVDETAVRLSNFRPSIVERLRVCR